MAVVRNLMLRIGADYSDMRKGMQGATRQLNRFGRDAERTTSNIRGRKGLGGISTEFKSLGRSVTDSLGRISGAKGLGGVASELGNLRPIMASATRGISGLGLAAGGAGAAFGGAALGVGAFVGVLALATVGIYKASQTAVKFEADIGRLNITLRESARGYMDWARAQGLAKQTAAALGATYGNLLGSFISDTKELTSSTQDLVHATRVIASNTGRDLGDVFNRIRSGMLGSTEAIEDLGVYVNISMIESTNAFRKFAGDKSWSQLTFQQQQQIRLAAILEQTHARYGKNLQDNVMTKQERLMEQLKDIKLNLSQAFLPIWDAVLPALTELAEALAYTTEQLARFTYWVRGMDYDERTRGMDRETDAVKDVGDAYEETGKQAKKASNELAAFDRLNLIGSGSKSSSGGGGSGGSNGGGPGPGPGGNPPDTDSPWINPPRDAPRRKWRIEFDPPHPPDAGLGAVVVRIGATISEMIAETNRRLAELWGQIGLGARVSLQGLQAMWNEFARNLNGNLVPTMTLAVSMRWAEMWQQMQLVASSVIPSLQLMIGNLFSNMRAWSLETRNTVTVAWNEMLSSMQQSLNAYRPYLEYGWHLIAKAVRNLINPLEDVKVAWKEALSFMQQQLDAYRPYLEWGWHLLSLSIRNLGSPLKDISKTWDVTWQNMLSTVQSKVSGIVSQVGLAIASMERLRGALGVDSPAASPSAPSPTGSIPTPWDNKGIFRDTLGEREVVKYTGRPEWLDNAPVIGEVYMGLDWLREQTSFLEALEGEVSPGLAGGAAFRGIAKGAPYAADVIEQLWKRMKSIPIPGFATGAVVHGPTLAMVGDNPGAMSDPEIIAPLSKLNDMIDTGASDEEIDLLRQILQAVRDPKTVKAVVSQNDITQASISGINDQTRRRGGRSPLTT